MRIAIFGVGALGCLFGARLTPHADVTLIGSWPEQLAALSTGPLTLIEPDGRETQIRLAVHGPEGLIPPVDVALILTKAPRSRRAAEGAADILTPGGLALSLQNGLGAELPLVETLGPDRVAVGVTSQGAALLGPGRIRYGGPGETLLETRADIAAQVAELKALFDQASLPTVLTEDIRAARWGKLALNCAINPLTALLRVTNGALIESKHLRALLREAAQEVEAVALAQGISLPFDAAGRALEVARLTAANRSSMLQDVERGVRTEVEWINGAVVAQAERLGLVTPVNRSLYQLIRGMEASYAQPEDD